MRTLAVLLLLSACANSTIQPLTKNSFVVTTMSDCAAVGARKVANQVAAIEVINRGGDLYVINQQRRNSEVQGAIYSYGVATSIAGENQELYVKVVNKGDPGSKDALSAREMLGPNWEEIVAAGFPTSC